MRNSNKSSGNGLITLLTTLLVVCAVAEAGIASYVGLNIRAAQKANAEIAAQQEAYQEYQEQTKQNTPAVQYIGPTVHVVDNTLIEGAWEPTPASGSIYQSSWYTPAPIPKVEAPKLDLDMDYGKIDIAPIEPKTSTPPKISSNPPASSSGTGGSSNSSQLADVPKPSVSSGSSPNAGSNKSSSEGSWGESSTTNEITGSLDRKAYWVSSGKSYHFSSGCPSLARSKNILEGTLQDALNAGKTDPCNNCAGGS